MISSVKIECENDIRVLLRVWYRRAAAGGLLHLALHL